MKITKLKKKLMPSETPNLSSHDENPKTECITYNLIKVTNEYTGPSLESMLKY